jgi:hypothetical protein
MASARSASPLRQRGRQRQDLRGPQKRSAAADQHALSCPIGDIGFYYVSVVLGLATLFLYSLLRSSVRRALKLRDAEKAESSGVNRWFYTLPSR